MRKQTNADKIRSMSDEQLGELLGNMAESLQDCLFCPAADRVCDCIVCKDGVKEWLLLEADNGSSHTGEIAEPERKNILNTFLQGSYE